MAILADSNHSTRLLVFILLFTMSMPGLTRAGADARGLASANAIQTPFTNELPAEYGQVIYQSKPLSAQRIYIIGQSHRSSLTGKSGPRTIQSQAEIYRIGEWLIEQKNVELLLPEGFFKRSSSAQASQRNSAAMARFSLATAALKEQLGNPEQFVNADLLLGSNYNLCLGQIEDERLYRDIGQVLAKLQRDRNFATLCDLNRLQEQRTLKILQNIPHAVENAFQAGQISSRQAIFTIGLAHIKDIIAMLQTPAAPALPEQLESALPWEEDYGVTIIIPRSLLDTKRIARLAGSQEQ